MKMKFIKTESLHHLEMSDCSLVEASAAVGLLIHILYNQIRSSDTVAAQRFKEMMIQSVSDQQSPVWAETDISKGAAVSRAQILRIAVDKEELIRQAREEQG